MRFLMLGYNLLLLVLILHSLFENISHQSRQLKDTFIFRSSASQTVLMGYFLSCNPFVFRAKVTAVSGEWGLRTAMLVSRLNNGIQNVFASSQMNVNFGTDFVVPRG